MNTRGRKIQIYVSAKCKTPKTDVLVIANEVKYSRSRKNTFTTDTTGLISRNSRSGCGRKYGVLEKLPKETHT